ncbi:PadR family transcriptional regulator [Agrococcus sp. SL85]|uniref:PadR family transcriptional regulator n=1 Tax=Agrococcus sp. SL85 TaxID=2995141 RepID=UPI00226D3525|nr:PadR family transcriptional regulator [Agrococcus sp. SL85]WAC66624.1 PadR family transcriptional regulator [Agrococcus sp. SL85]
MSPAVFGHGALRLYLLSLLAEAPRHGYELMQALEHRFGGTYTPSAGTIYPRLAKLEEEGLVTKAVEGRKSTYAITDAGRAELAAREHELRDLEGEITDSVRRMASEVREGVRSAMRSLRADLAAAERDARDAARSAPDPNPWPTGWGEAPDASWAAGREESAAHVPNPASAPADDATGRHAPDAPGPAAAPERDARAAARMAVHDLDLQADRVPAGGARASPGGGAASA